MSGGGRRVRRRAPARDGDDGEDASLTSGLLALSLLGPAGGGSQGHSRHSSISAGSDSTFRCPPHVGGGGRGWQVVSMICARDSGLV